MATVGERIIASAKQALEFSKGKVDHGCIVHIPENVDVRNIRKKLHMTQADFAKYFGVNVRTIQDWEQGRRVPSGVSKNFLFVIDKEPEAVRRALTVQ